MRSAKIALGLASLLVGLLLGEVLLSWIKPQLYRRPRVWQFDRELGWAHIPRASGWLVKPEFEVEYHINADGLRDRKYKREKAAQIYRLLVFGDSFAEGWGVQLEESVSKQLEKMGQGTGGKAGFEVINFGVAGYGTDQEMLLFQKLGQFYQPDRVLVFFYANDLLNNALPRGIGAERGNKPFFKIGRDQRLRLHGVPVKKAVFWDEKVRASRPWPARLRYYLGQHWHLFALIDKALAPAVSKDRQQRYYEALYGTKGDSRLEGMWELTGRLLQAFHFSIRQAGAEMLLVYVPAIVQAEEGNWRYKRDLHGLIGEFDLQKPNRKIAELAKRYGIPVLDLYEPFKQASRTRQLYYRESHWNAQGHALAASLIWDCLHGERNISGPLERQIGVRRE